MQTTSKSAPYSNIERQTFRSSRLETHRVRMRDRLVWTIPRSQT